jgi:hypothetical protein
VIRRENRKAEDEKEEVDRDILKRCGDTMSNVMYRYYLSLDFFFKTRSEIRVTIYLAIFFFDPLNVLTIILYNFSKRLISLLYFSAKRKIK